MELTLTVDRAAAPGRNGVGAAWIRSVFGLAEAPPATALRCEAPLHVEPGDVVLLTGPSGSGKSSLLRAAADQLRRRLGDAAVVALQPPADSDQALIDALGLEPRAAAMLLAACGLGEAPLLLRRPRQLSEGQRARLSVAQALAARPRALVADEWCATLDRMTAQVVSRNVRRLARRRGVIVLAATCHDDLLDDLQPDVHIACRLDGPATLRRRPVVDGPVSFARRLRLAPGSARDWPRFARWHYRGGSLGPVRRVTLLLDGDEPVGICVMGPGALASAARNRLFGLDALPPRIAAEIVNRRFVSVTRLVLDPRVRGAGLGALFLRRACRQAPVDWVELVAEMGHLARFAESAGFVRVGVGRAGRTGRSFSAAHCTASAVAAYRRRVRHSRPVCYLFDNRARDGDSLDPSGPWPPAEPQWLVEGEGEGGSDRSVGSVGWDSTNS